MTRYIFVTGGVVSSLGKGVITSSLAAVLEARQLNVNILKMDPYINVDPGTMSPFQHGEVFVTVDGAETDLDLGNYERYHQRHHDARPTILLPDGSTTRSAAPGAPRGLPGRVPFRSFRISPTKSSDASRRPERATMC